MRKYVLLDETGRIIGTSDINYPQSSWKLIDFPENFDFESQQNYGYINGELAFLESSQDNQPAPDPTIEDRLAALEGAMLAMMGGAAYV